jgi:hypothetical protein
MLIFSGKEVKHSVILQLKRVRKGAVINTYMRPLCKSCKKKPCAVNYYKGKTVYYRSKCDGCASGTSPRAPLWYQLGYRQKDFCEKCGFKNKSPEVFNVLHIDGDLTNCRPTNLKTICANCQRTLQKEGVKWKQGDLTPDF